LASGVLAIDRVEINTASLEELDILTGIGPAYAQKIIDARPFSSLDDLIKVKGIGEKTLQKIKDQGLAYVATQGSLPLVAEETMQPEIEEATEPITAINEPIKEVATSDIAVAMSDVHQIYPSGIIFSEILPSPEGADDTEEWVEIFNKNNFEVDLSGWKIQDIEGIITTYVFPENTKITSHEYLILKRPETKITLNNTKDGLNFLTPDEKVIDSLIYNNANRSQSYNKTDSGLPTQTGWEWSDLITPGSSNTISQGREKNTNGLSNLKKSDISKEIDAGVAIASLTKSSKPTLPSLDSRANPWFLFLTALTITIFSATAILFIKLKLFKKIHRVK